MDDMRAFFNLIDDFAIVVQMAEKWRLSGNNEGDENIPV